MDYAKQLEVLPIRLMIQAWRLSLNCIQHSDTFTVSATFNLRLYHKAKWLPVFKLVSGHPKALSLVQSIESNHPHFDCTTKSRSIMPLVNCAAGRLFASYLPEHFVRPLLETEWQKHPGTWAKLVAPHNWEKFLELKETIRQQQMSPPRKGDLLTGINAVGLPVFNSNQGIEFLYCGA